MTSREELRQAKKQQKKHAFHWPLKRPKVTTQSGHETGNETPTPQTVVVKEVRPDHHFLSIILTTIVMVAIILGGTILNQRFIASEISQSSIGDTIVTQANDSLHQYGISESVVTHRDVQKLLTQAIGQLYNGQSINLDLSTIDGRLTNAVDNQLSNSGFAGSVATSTVVDGLEKQVNSTINDSLNTPQMVAAAQTIRVARWINSGVIVVGSLLMALSLISALLKHHFVNHLMWMAGGGVIITGAVVFLLRQGIPELAHAYPAFSEFAVTFATDFASFGAQVIGVATICFLGALLGRLGLFVRARRNA